jgi:hypothetical protein
MEIPMKNKSKALIFGAAVWFIIAISENLLIKQQFVSAEQTYLLMIPISLIVILGFALKYLGEIHAQYEEEGLELGLYWAGESIVLEFAIYCIFYGMGFDYFLLIGTWIGVLFKFVFPMAAGMYMQHKIGI